MHPVAPWVPWAWRDPEYLAGTFPAAWAPPPDLVGYRVEATDGRIGSVGEAGEAGLVVDTGPWIFGRLVRVPAGAVRHVDHAGCVVYLDRTRDEIQHAPRCDG